MNNPPAFPVQFQGTTEPSLSGMTLRDYFAAKAMQKLMGTRDMDECCQVAYRWADQMLEAREA